MTPKRRKPTTKNKKPSRNVQREKKTPAKPLTFRTPIGTVKWGNFSRVRVQKNGDVVYRDGASKKTFKKSQVDNFNPAAFNRPTQAKNMRLGSLRGVLSTTKNEVKKDLALKDLAKLRFQDKQVSAALETMRTRYGASGQQVFEATEAFFMRYERARAEGRELPVWESIYPVITG